MHLTDLHITVAVTPQDDVQVLYAGVDITQAQKRLAAASTDFREVGVLSHCPPVMPRFPIEEAADALARASAAEDRANAEHLARQKTIADKRALAHRLTAEAAALETPVAAPRESAEQKPKPPRRPQARD